MNYYSSAPLCKTTIITCINIDIIVSTCTENCSSAHLCKTTIITSINLILMSLDVQNIIYLPYCVKPLELIPVSILILLSLRVQKIIHLPICVIPLKLPLFILICLSGSVNTICLDSMGCQNNILNYGIHLPNCKTP